MKLINDYNSRCKNKFLRIEIGIAPQDEPQMTFKTLNRLALLFAKQMGLDGHQWVDVTHKDTDNLHIHIIANRISLGGQDLRHHFREQSSRESGRRTQSQARVDYRQRSHYRATAPESPSQSGKRTHEATSAEHQLRPAREAPRKGLSGHSMFLYELHRSGVTIERMKNKQGKVYGLKFTYDGHSFKASEISREFGFRSLPK